MPLLPILAILGSLGFLLVAWVGYPLFVRHRARGRQAPGAQALAAAAGGGWRRALPDVTVIVATRDEPDTVVARVRDLRAADYPSEKLDVVVALDRNVRQPQAAYEAAVAEAGLGDSVRVLLGDAPGGKAAALNVGVAAARTELLVFADARQTFSPTAIRDLVVSVGAEGVGAVSGVVRSAKDDALLDRYWEYELALRRNQAAVHSIICVSGAIYALRRELWRPMPPGLICDDLFVTLGVVLEGRRVGFCESAIATDPREFTREQHFDRKVRTLTGLLQLCAWRPAVLAPWRNAIWLDFALHKLSRIIVPYLAVAAALATTWVAYAVGGRWAFAAGALLVCTLGALFVLRPRLGSSALWAAKLFLVPLIATWNAVRGRWQVWTSHAARPPHATQATALPDSTPARRASL